MKTIHVSPIMQILLVLALIGAFVAGVLAQGPEIQRYLKVRSMD
jgi:hypothetical protein